MAPPSHTGVLCSAGHLRPFEGESPLDQPQDLRKQLPQPSLPPWHGCPMIRKRTLVLRQQVLWTSHRTLANPAPPATNPHAISTLPNHTLGNFARHPSLPSPLAFVVGFSAAASTAPLSCHPPPTGRIMCARSLCICPVSPPRMYSSPQPGWNPPLAPRPLLRFCLLVLCSPANLALLVCMLFRSAVPPPAAWACQYQLTSEPPALFCSIAHVALSHCSTSSQVGVSRRGQQAAVAAAWAAGRASSLRSLQGSVLSGRCANTISSSPTLCRWQCLSCGARSERCDRSPEL